MKQARLVLLGAALALPAWAVAPRAVVITTANGEATVPIRMHEDRPLLAAPLLAKGLPLAISLDVDRGTALVGLQGTVFECDADRETIGRARVGARNAA